MKIPVADPGVNHLNFASHEVQEAKEEEHIEIATFPHLFGNGDTKRSNSTKKKEKNFRTKYLGESEKNREKLPPGKIYLADSHQQRAAAAHHHLTLIFLLFAVRFVFMDLLSPSQIEPFRVFSREFRLGKAWSGPA